MFTLFILRVLLFSLNISMDDIIDIADLDVIYLSYDESAKEEFWLKIKNMVPWAKRVDGIKGSDAAHKAAGEASNTERFGEHQHVYLF